MATDQLMRFVLDGLLAQVERMTDPWVKRSLRPLLTDILVLSTCGVLSGCKGCVEIAEYGRRKAEFFRTILELPHGIPSQDTFNRVLALLKPQALQECLIGWLPSVRDEAGDARRAADRHRRQVAAAHVRSGRRSEHATLGERVVHGRTVRDGKTCEESRCYLSSHRPANTASTAS